AALAAALEVRRGLGETAPTVGFDGVRRRPAGGSFADQALFDLLTAAWRADALDGDQDKDALAYLQTQLAPLTRTTADTAAAETKDSASAAPAPAAGTVRDARAARPGRFRRLRRSWAAPSLPGLFGLFVGLFVGLVIWLVIGSSSASAMVGGIGLDNPRTTAGTARTHPNTSRPTGLECSAL
uniref:hypothetical protein n=1 Tax=Streptomyces scabiei TaxID=1930 RepID=UPI0013C4F24F